MRLGPFRSRWFVDHELAPVTDSSGVAIAGAITGPAGGAEGMWVYVVPDLEAETDAQIVISMVYDGDVHTGALDLSGFSAASGDAAVLTGVSWSQVDLVTAGGSATDRAHVYAEGSHWMSHSVAADAELWLLQVDPADARGGGAVVTPTAVVKVYSETDNTALFYNDPTATGEYYSINDHFLVHVPGGIAVGIWRNGKNAGDLSLKMIVVDTSTMALSAEYDIGGTASVDCNTTGSARQVPVPGATIATGSRALEILVPDDIADTGTENDLNLLTTDDVFTAIAAATATYEETGQHLQMASFFRLENGDYVVAYKRIPIGGNYSGGTQPAVYSDWGDIKLAVLDPSMSLTALWSELCLEAGSTVDSLERAGNRPHVAQWRRYVFTCWDTLDLGTQTASGSYLQINWLVA